MAGISSEKTSNLEGLSGSLIQSSSVTGCKSTTDEQHGEVSVWQHKQGQVS